MSTTHLTHNPGTTIKKYLCFLGAWVKEDLGPQFISS